MNKNNMQTPYDRVLREKIVKYFSSGELRILCYDLRIDDEEITGEEKIEKIVALILYVQRRNRMNDLIKELARVRPNINWERDTIETDSEDEFCIKMVASSRSSFDRELHKAKHQAMKIDMAGISLSRFLEEINHDPHQKLIARLINEDIRVRIIFVHPKADFLAQRWVEDNKRNLDDLIKIQKSSVELCVKFFKQLNDYYNSARNLKSKPDGRLMVKLTKFCPYVSIERYDSSTYWGLYTSDSAGIYAPMFLATLEDNYLLFDKFRNHYIHLLSKDINKNKENVDLYLISMEAGAPKLNRTLAEDILGEEKVKEILEER